MKTLLLVCSLVWAALLSACSSDSATGSAPTDQPIGQNSAPAPEFQPYALDSAKLKQTPSGLRYQIVTQGQGNMGKPGEEVIAHYHGTLMDGTVFDSSHRRGQPFSFVLGQGRVIQGWDEAFQLFPVGTRAILLVPANLAYGERGSPPTIPPNTPLRFDVEFLGTKAPSNPSGPQMFR